MPLPQDACVYLSIAANLDPRIHIHAAIQKLASTVHLDDISPFYRTEALGRPEQPDYLNGVARIHTPLSPEALKNDVLRPLEAQLGRKRTADSYAARTIDLDMLLYNDIIRANETLTLPDPDIVERVFLCAGLLSLAPDLVLPGDNCPLHNRVDKEALATLEIDAAFSRSMKELLTP